MKLNMLIISLLMASPLNYHFFFFFLMIRRPPRSTLFPYPPLSRSCPPRLLGSTCRTSQPVQQTSPESVASRGEVDRKSTRLNSSHGYISYAVFCLKKKKIRIRRSSVLTRKPDDWCVTSY